MNLEDYFEALRFGLPNRPALAHRLDRDTSGCLVLGRHRKALSRLGRLFAGGLVEKVYWAVVLGRPADDAGRVELALRKRSEGRGWWMEPSPDGRAAATDWRLLGTDGRHSWLECRPRTGRTHQIRVHCAALGCPVLGDPIYGRAEIAAPLASPCARRGRPAASRPAADHRRGAGTPAHDGDTRGVEGTGLAGLIFGSQNRLVRRARPGRTSPS